ncbi:uncharacterized protein EV420DRAFT_1749930 [Desarmillaria tabescens]|uniref:C2H2-type domain-containing protein n=1 Tax=Armillaria tabescens TaxID=1929756 RepID=A0AA39MZS8_ARMTA|nr:uncharacterized protein EV420DRAFT_1749930 [Desarmillaria tabescens]KAK0452119.1 hypothetical protein EV420DRAFT_1749930 [Desarmillaria tabescens]
MPAVRQKTTGGKVFYCPIHKCKFSAKSSSNLKIHLNRHYNLKPYVCKDRHDCGFASADPAALLKHRVAFHQYVTKSWPTNQKAQKRPAPYSKLSSRARVKIVKPQTKNDIESVSQVFLTATPPSTATVDLQGCGVVDVDACSKTFAHAYNLRSNPHPYAKELLPALRSCHPLEDHTTSPVAMPSNAQPSIPTFPPVNFPQENVPPAELSSPEPSPMLELLLRTIDSVEFDNSMTANFATDGGISPASLPPIHVAPLTTQWRGNASAYAENVVSFSPQPKTRLTDFSTCQNVSAPSVDLDAALSTFLDSLELESESPASYQVPSPSVLSDYFNSASYQSSDFGVSTFEFEA